MRNTELLQANNYYHIFNRGIDRTNIFQTPDDYSSFLERLEKCSKNVLDIFAYCLLKNHFHSLIYVKQEIALPRLVGAGQIKLTAAKQLGHLFNGYAQSFNRRHDRTGGLFEKPFKRKQIESKDGLISLSLYIHTNPVHHCFVKDLEEWPYSSFHELISDGNSFLKKHAVFELFHEKENFISSHRD